MENDCQFPLKVSKNTLTLEAQRGEKVINSRQTIVGRGFVPSPHCLGVEELPREEVRIHPFRALADNIGGLGSR